MTALWISAAGLAGVTFGYWLRKRLMWKVCPDCKGAGYLVMRDKKTLTCPNCMGTGKIPRKS